ncbi:MAG: hypothetical protein WB424_08915 [Terracidiphilus sp.]
MKFRTKWAHTLLIGALAVGTGSHSVKAQSLDDLNIQIHGYATQGFLYSSANNLFTTNSSNGSPAWTEAVVNVTAQPTPKLRVGVQARYFLLGNLGNAITLDWAAADYKVDDRFGVRFGKVKTPIGLFNEIQDIDPGFIWVLLPQSVYPLESRNSLLAHYGGVVYGTLKLGPKLGKLEYRGFGGERVMAGTDGYFIGLTENGINLPNGINGVTIGGALHWKTPLTGLMIGASDGKDEKWIAPATSTYSVQGMSIPLSGTFTINPLNMYNLFGQYEKNKIMLAAEYDRIPGTVPIYLTSSLTGPISVMDTTDQRSWYGMMTYKLSNKFTAGIYDSQQIDHQAALGPYRYQKDWAINGRYDFNSFLYAKAEQHFIQGTGQNIDRTMNPNGTTTNFKLTALKIGVSF